MGIEYRMGDAKITDSAAWLRSINSSRYPGGVGIRLHGYDQGFRAMEFQSPQEVVMDKNRDSANH
jgi:hypothetical protein